MKTANSFNLFRMCIVYIIAIYSTVGDAGNTRGSRRRTQELLTSTGAPMDFSEGQDDTASSPAHFEITKTPPFVTIRQKNTQGN